MCNAKLIPVENFNYDSFTLIDRKSRVPQLQGVQGRSCPAWAGPRALGNPPSLFKLWRDRRRRWGGIGFPDLLGRSFQRSPKGKQNENVLNDNSSSNFTPVFHFVYDQLGFQYRLKNIRTVGDDAIHSHVNETFHFRTGVRRPHKYLDA